MKVSVMAPYRATARMMMPQNRHIKHLLWNALDRVAVDDLNSSGKLVLVNKLGSEIRTWR